MQKAQVNISFDESCPKPVQELINNMIVIKPEKRYSIDEVLASPVFACFREPEVESELEKTLPDTITPESEYLFADVARRQLNPKIMDLNLLNFSKKKDNRKK